MRGVRYLGTGKTSWRRHSDPTHEHVDARSPRGGKALPAQVKELRQLETWENEGGQPALSAAPVRILIVDDDIKSSDTLEIMLHAAGYSETRVAYSGHAALALADVFRPDVVLLELSLLDMSGYKVARLLRERARSHDLRLIALTSGREHGGRGLAGLAGFERYLLKPIAARDLPGLLNLEADRDQLSPRGQRQDP